MRIEDEDTLKKGMTLCKTCGAEIAKTAHTCPHCGAKLKSGSGWFTTIFRFLIAPIILFIIYWAWVQYTYHKAVEETMNAYTQAVDETMDAYTQAIDETMDDYSRAVNEAAQSYTDAMNEAVGEMANALWGN